MNIDFKSLKSQQVDNKTLLNIIEVLYNFTISGKNPNIIFNEFVDDVKQDEKEFDAYVFELKEKPISINDISIVSENGSIVLTPASIVELDGNIVSVKSLQIKKGTNFFVTYKY